MVVILTHKITSEKLFCVFSWLVNVIWIVNSVGENKNILQWKILGRRKSGRRKVSWFSVAAPGLFKASVNKMIYDVMI